LAAVFLLVPGVFRGLGLICVGLRDEGPRIAVVIVVIGGWVGRADVSLLVGITHADQVPQSV
jgi:hypothetical protein